MSKYLMQWAKCYQVCYDWTGIGLFYIKVKFYIDKNFVPLVYVSKLAVDLL